MIETKTRVLITLICLFFCNVVMADVETLGRSVVKPAKETVVLKNRFLLPKLLSGQPLIIDAIKAGAYADGKHDDSKLLQHLIDSIHNKGGGTLFLSSGVYLLNNPDQKGSNIIGLRSKVNIKGNGSKSILKLGDDLLNKYPGLRILYFTNSKQEASLDNVVYENFTVDCNGMNNIPPSEAQAKKYKGTAIGARLARHVLINNITVINNSGRNTFAFGGSGDMSQVNDITIQNCTVRNVARGVKNNIFQNDHSAIFIRGDSCNLNNNKFTNDILKTGATAIEAHCINTTIKKNYISNFSKGFNIAAMVNNVNNVTVESNTLRNVYTCLMFWSLNGFAIDNVKIINNDVELQGGLYPVFDLKTQVKIPFKHVSISNNAIKIKPGQNAGNKANFLYNSDNDLKLNQNIISTLAN